MQAPLTERASGVLLHLTSLPSPWGIGDLGARARQFAERLGGAGQRYWQVLPLNPTTAAAGESPYFSNSSRAGNPLLISLEDLVDDGLLEAAELKLPTLGTAGFTDFPAARRNKEPLLISAAQRFEANGDDAGFREFCSAQWDWLEDHALFTALRGRFGDAWDRWPEGLKTRNTDALAEYRDAMQQDVEIEKRLQYLFHRQWQRLREHCWTHSVWLFGDIPIYVNYESVDVWANAGMFKLDAGMHPLVESGVPPDYFSSTGQLWHNPIYDWAHLAEDGFRWWLGRLSTQLQRLDVLRIDHFRGLVQYWEIPAGAEDAISGVWRDVPAEAFFDSLRATFDPLPVVAEDLGIITPDVTAMRESYGFPGMVVLQFAFGEDNDGNPYLPHNHPENAVAYLGTHDNNTARGWLEEEMDDAMRWRLSRYVEIADSESTVRALIDLLESSRARTAIVSAQDLLALPASARMNTPGHGLGNWTWQLTDEDFDRLPWDWLAERCRAHGR